MKMSGKTVVMGLIAILCGLALTAGVVSAEPLSFKGTVRYITLEGGFWGIVSQDGKNYEPVNLGAKFKHDGLPVQVEAVRKDRAGIHMWGAIIEITSISKVENAP